MKKESMSAEKAFEILLSNSRLGSMLEIKKDFRGEIVDIEDIESFSDEVHRNSLIAFNIINGD